MARRDKPPAQRGRFAIRERSMQNAKDGLAGALLALPVGVRHGVQFGAIVRFDRAASVGAT